MVNKSNKKSPTPSPAQVAGESPEKTPKKSPETEKRNSNLISYKIRLLDNAQPSLNLSISKNATGENLFAMVCEELGGIVERDYFGLRFTDKHKTRQWLDLGRSVKKQMTGTQPALSFRIKHYPGDPMSDFHQELSQYLLYLQIRRDLVLGRLLCPKEELYTIGALIYQSELGDAPEDDLNGSTEEAHSPECEPQPTDFNNINSPTSPDTSFKAVVQPGETSQNLKIIFNQTEKMAEEFAKVHKSYRGLTARDAEIEILKRVSKLPTYGVDPIPVKVIEKNKATSKKPRISGSMGGSEHADVITTNTAPAALKTATQSSEDASHSVTKSTSVTPSGAVYLGLRHTGLTTYVGLEPSSYYNCLTEVPAIAGLKIGPMYTWDQINRLACDGKDFIVILKQEEADPKDKKRKRVKPETIIFRCDSKDVALATWKWTIDRKSFFTLKAASEAKKTKTTSNIFRRSHSYRFIGKSQSELRSITSSGESIPQPAFERVSSLRRCQKSTDSDFPEKNATLPARIRLPAGDDRHPFSRSEPTKRPELLGALVEPAPVEETPCAPPVAPAVMNISEDLASAPMDDPETPIRPVLVNQVEMSQPDTNPISADLDNSVNEVSEVELRQRTIIQDNGISRDSESIRALKEIDQAIDSHQPNARHLKSSESLAPNGEVPCPGDNKVSPMVEKDTGAVVKDSSNQTLIHIAEATTLFVGIVCFTVLIAAIESHPQPGQDDLWSKLASRVQGQPLIASFNSYIYSPIRGHVVGGFSALSSWLGGH